MSRRRLVLVVVSVASALSLVAGVLAAVGVFGGRGSAPSASAGSPVTVHPVPGHKVAIPAMWPWSQPRTSWPTTGTGTAVIAAGTVPGRAALAAGPSAGSGRAGALPVWVGPPDARTLAASGFVAQGTVARVRVDMASHAAAGALGVRGVVFSLARSDGSPAASRVHVSLGYASFAQAAGGGYASRLHLVQLPVCALTTPALARCRTQVPVRSADDVRAAMLGADVGLPGAGVTASVRGSAVLTSAVTAPVLVLAAVSSPSGSGGNYAAEPMSEASTWVSGDSSGGYSYSYPVDVPPVPGGLQPHVSLDYRSQATDGLTSATNNEASWIGDGWDYSPGYIEVDYPACATVAFGPPTGDLCPETQGLTLVRNGVATPIVAASGGVYKAEADGGEEVLNQTTYWEIIEPDGTQYYYGKNQLPGYTSGDPATNSVWTVPVLSGSGFASQPWRYMLDYVVDPHGNAIAYYYNTQTNYYAEDNGTTGTGAYTQGGTLAKIQYGLRAGAVYGVTPAAQVTFTTSSTARSDAPADLACAQGAACTVTSPTFWTSYALTSISTQSLINGSLRNVDSWALAGTYPSTGDSTTSPSLWLASVTRTGQDGTTPVTLPPTSFAGTPMPNLVATSATTSAGYSLITRLRLTSLTNENGGVTTVSYSPQDTACAAGTFPALDANTGACYPDYWYTGLPSSLNQVQDWFNVYPVAKVTDTDTTGGDPPVVTSYSYAGAAWHYNDDTVSRSATTTWDQWRGFGAVTTQTGTSPDPVTQTTGTYFQGMDQDRTHTTPRMVTLTSTRGDAVHDSGQYAGMLFEDIVYDGAGTGNQVTDTVYIPYTSTATAKSSSGMQSFITGTSSIHTYTAIATGGPRESTVTNTYNSYGQVVTTSTVPDTSNAAEDTCTTTSYAVNSGKSSWLVDLPSEIGVVALPCGTTPTQASQAVSDIKYTYDGGGTGTPTAGNLTQVQQGTSVAAVTGVIFYNYTTVQTSSYDQYGRLLTSADADNRSTTDAYTPATGAEPTSVQVTDPASLVTTTTYDPARDLPLTATDPAGYQTVTIYDALGRVTATWTPGNPSSGPPVNQYSYTVSNSAPSVTTEQSEQPGGGYLTSQTLTDSFGQVRETQDQTAGGGTDVADTSFNSDGWKALVSDPYYTSGPPSGTLVAAAPGSVPSQTGYLYDGAGRVIKQIAYALGTQTWETDTTYGGNYVTVVPPAGGTPQTTFTDGRGLTTAIYQYHAGAPASPTDPAADYDQTSYTYTPAKKLASVTDAAGNTWSWTYDLPGNQLTATDPDSGTATSTYDAASQLITVTDARGKQVSYTYDQDGRKTAEYDTTGGALETSADQLAAWTWDTLANGKLTSSTAFWSGAAYTEAVTGYNSLGLPSGTQTVIPPTQGALAGTYTQQDSYAPDGALTAYTDSAAGGLPAETVTTGYDAAGQATSLTGTSNYVDSLSYTTLGEPLQYTMGTSAEPAYITDSYDPQTRRLTEQDTQAGTAQTSVDDLHYTYDQSGNITSEADTPAGSPADVQCFQYDYLARLVQAWAQGTAGCASTPSASAEGGPAPYWSSYAYNAIGNLTGITSTTPAGTVTTTTDGYPAAGAARPHAVTASSVTGPSGTASTSYNHDANGDLTTVSGPTQSQALTWDDAGRLVQDAVTPPGGSAQDTGYVYDAGGTLLIAADPGTTTLYLPDEELSLSTTTGTVTGTRYYSLGGHTIAARTGASTLDWLAGDQQGTDSIAIDASALTVTARYYDPYGNPRGTTPPAFPAGQKGFVGGTADAATGLTNLGIRQYQPATGSFISPDPILKPYDPQDLNPYAYSADNPATYSDPTGAIGGPQITGQQSDGSTCAGGTTYVVNHGCSNPPPAPRGSSPAPSDPPGTGGHRICNYYGCASATYWHHHHSNPSAHKPAPVTTGHSRTYGRSCVVTPRGTFCTPDTSGGSGFWNWFRNHWQDIAAGIGIVASILCGLDAKGAGSALCDLADAPALGSLASDVSDATGGTFEVLKSGYKITIPFRRRNIVVRIMEEGGGRVNYYRVSISGGKSFTVTGDGSTDRSLTHIPISNTSLQDILNIISRITK